MVRPFLLALGVVPLLASVACKPELEGRPSLVDRGRVVAVRSEPAELKPDDKAPVHYTALYVGATGTLDDAALDFALCNARKPIAVTGPVALECLASRGRSLVPIRGGDIALAADACRVFGPTPPEPKPGEPASRAADPDTTGGYYQPARVMYDADGETEFAVGVTRLSCGLPGANQEQSFEYTDRYRANENPAVDALTVAHGGGRRETFPDDPAAPPLAVKPGEHVTFGATWAKCPLNSACGDGICGPGEATTCAPGRACTKCEEDCKVPRGCTGSEPYVVLDPAQRVIVDRREAIRASWFATEGDFDHDRTGRSEEQATDASTDNGWTAPGVPGLVHLWLVLRDDRGGVGWREFDVDVQR